MGNTSCSMMLGLQNGFDFFLKDHSHHDKLSCIVNRFVLFCIVSFHIVSYRTVSNLILSYRVVLYHIISYNILLYHIASYHIILASYWIRPIATYCIASFRIVSYRTYRIIL